MSDSDWTLTLYMTFDFCAEGQAGVKGTPKAKGKKGGLVPLGSSARRPSPREKPETKILTPGPSLTGN